MEQKTASSVVKVFAILNWIGSAIAIISGISLVLFGESASIAFTGQEFASMLFLLPILGFMLMLFGVAGAIIAYGLWQHKNWARIAIIVFAVLTVLNPPLGTIIGLLELWLFGFQKDVKALFGA